jgi:hypothetical protein
LVMPLREEVMIFTVSIVTLWTIFSSKSLQWKVSRWFVWKVQQRHPHW